MSIRALVVDDHPIIRDTLVATLTSMKVIDQIDAVSSFQKLVEKLQGDVDYQLLILDLSLMDSSGADGVIYIRGHFPDIPVVIFSGNDSVDIIVRCFENGVHGFIPKTSPMQIFVNAIRIVLAGGTYIPPEYVSLMGFETSGVVSKHSLSATDAQVRFTPKQYQVYELLLQGMPNKVIARRLNLAEGTVKAHLHSIYEILQVNNRAQAILKSRHLQIAQGEMPA